jgi:hypothetical protein
MKAKSFILDRMDKDCFHRGFDGFSSFVSFKVCKVRGCFNFVNQGSLYCCFHQKKNVRRNYTLL